VLAIVALAALAGCGDDDDDSSAPEPAPIPAPTEVTEELALQPTIESMPNSDPDFLAGVLADGEVTADELATAYDRYIDCLAAGGASGEYAYDVELHATIVFDPLDVAGDDGLGNHSASLLANCSRDFLGDLVHRYYAAHPDSDETSTRQRASIVACVQQVDPAAAADVPDEVTTDSLSPGFYLSGTLDLSAMSTDPAVVPALERCFYSIGAPWRPFGGDTTPSAPPAATTA